MAYDAVEALLQFGVAMLRAGNTAARTHEWIEVIARKLTFDSVSVSQSLDSYYRSRIGRMDHGPA